MADYLAHVRRKEESSFAIHDLEDHLRAVGDLPSEFAAIFGASDLGLFSRTLARYGEIQGAF
ncbi:MAG TPA: hypothetical protein VJ746_01525 [Nitrospira sp.]|nr:hypothetical protein [Nitrospira sp.]